MFVELFHFPPFMFVLIQVIEIVEIFSAMQELERSQTALPDGK